MDFKLTEQQELLQEQLIQRAQSISAEDVAVDESTATGLRGWKACADAGIQSLPLEAGYGGLDLDPVSVAVALAAFGQGCGDSVLASSAAQQLLTCVVPLWKKGGTQQKDTYLPSLADGSRAAVLLAPHREGSVTRDRLVVETVPGGFLLNGKAGRPGISPQPDLLIAIAQGKTGSGGESTAFLLDRSRPGVSGDDAGAGLEFADVKLGESDILGSEGQGETIIELVNQWQQVYGSAVRIGAMQRLLEQLLSAAGRYARSCKLAGQPATAFQSASHRLGEFRIAVEAAKLLLYRAAWQFGVSGEATAEGGVAALFTDDALRKSALEALHVDRKYRLLAEPVANQALQDVVVETGVSASIRGREAVARQIGLVSS